MKLKILEKEIKILTLIGITVAPNEEEISLEK